MDPSQPRSGCSINTVVEVLGDPWDILVLRDIMFVIRRHFRGEPIATRRQATPV